MEGPTNTKTRRSVSINKTSLKSEMSTNSCHHYTPPNSRRVPSPRLTLKSTPLTTPLKHPFETQIPRTLSPTRSPISHQIENGKKGPRISVRQLITIASRTIEFYRRTHGWRCLINHWKPSWGRQFATRLSLERALCGMNHWLHSQPSDTGGEGECVSRPLRAGASYTTG